MVRAGLDDKSSSDELKNHGRDEDDGVPEYERQRLLRIKENRERLEALGLPILTSNLLSSVKKQSKRKGKGKKSEDDEYQPSSDEDNGASTSSEEGNEEEDVKVGDDVPSGSSRASTRKGNSKNSSKTGKAKKKDTFQKHASITNFIDDDAALQKAIALSLEGLTEVSDMERRESQIQEDAGKKKRRKMHTARVQMTEDEVILNFYQFDEAGKDRITVRDLQRVAIAHDFTWTDKEMMDMINSFDSDGDGKLSLEDFRRIVLRCNMIQGCKNAPMGSKS
ncbi:serrate RNA effector molecule homolog [Telopea speciosissima]|uniref:serrate RNA effector molecule homolog n=1 Tax=Telopea speciosissima TaxID=54955 RepID=UPI001CC78A44|nr:serrate RNA effector molecule homolog [Telopea speciosissima]